MFSTNEQRKCVSYPALLRRGAQKMLNEIYLEEHGIKGGSYSENCFVKLTNRMLALNEMYDQDNYRSAVKSTTDDPNDIIRLMNENSVDIEKKIEGFETMILKTSLDMAIGYEKKRKQLIKQTI